MRCINLRLTYLLTYNRLMDIRASTRSTRSKNADNCNLECRTTVIRIDINQKSQLIGQIDPSLHHSLRHSEHCVGTAVNNQ